MFVCSVTSPFLDIKVLKTLVGLAKLSNGIFFVTFKHFEDVNSRSFQNLVQIWAPYWLDI